MSYAPPKIIIHYIAPGFSPNSSSLASHPLSPFWNLRLEDGAIWNQLQHVWDRQHNPILRKNTTWKPSAQLLTETEDACSDCMSDACSVPHKHDLNSLPEQMRAFIRSMHCREYPTLINQPDMCRRGAEIYGVDSPMLLMAIKSQVGNFENRQAIRETWGRSGLVFGDTHKKGELVQTVFLLGRQDSSTESFYKGVYPPYAGGGGVVYSSSVALRLKEVSKRVRLFPIDDVYLGMCLQRLGLSPSHHPGFLTFDLPVTDRGNPCAYRSLMLVHRRTPNEMLTLWKQLQNLAGQC
ncbi:N-acetyllactosaminide beta-1,3-N-acetylglucosaminyltransferase 2 [Oryzias melastigma]|uniref:Hexosyltransferase n=1 Tax=Oryzias melastigma TaxID=30732 RepID=A0A834EYZ3_ORYME|nr:N-acetyllactosaminide beta-1,3-N-acetylglucosaminyltransferase 2 [Oryzias melastigma]